MANLVLLVRIWVGDRDAAAAMSWLAGAATAGRVPAAAATAVALEPGC